MLFKVKNNEQHLIGRIVMSNHRASWGFSTVSTVSGRSVSGPNDKSSAAVHRRPFTKRQPATAKVGALVRFVWICVWTVYTVWGSVTGVWQLDWSAAFGALKSFRMQTRLMSHWPKNFKIRDFLAQAPKYALSRENLQEFQDLEENDSIWGSSNVRTGILKC